MPMDRICALQHLNRWTQLRDRVYPEDREALYELKEQALARMLKDAL